MFTKQVINYGKADVIVLVNKKLRNDLLKEVYSFNNFLLQNCFSYEVINLGSFRFSLYFPSISSLKYSVSVLSRLSNFKSKNLSTIANIYLFIRCLEALKLYNYYKISNLINDNKYFIFSQEMEYHENIFAQCVLHSDKCSIALQHGFYNDEGSRVNMDNVNSVNYLSSVCDTVLLWGHTSRLIFSKYRPDANILVAGKFFQQPFKKISDNKSTVSIVFDSKDRVHSNSILDNVFLEFQSNNFVLNVLIHPDDSLRAKKYTRFIDSNKSVSNLVIGIHSTLLLELAYHDHDVYVHASSRLLNSCSSSLFSKISSISNFFLLNKSTVHNHLINDYSTARKKLYHLLQADA